MFHVGTTMLQEKIGGLRIFTGKKASPNYTQIARAKECQEKARKALKTHTDEEASS
jgi:hypothetical protein